MRFNLLILFMLAASLPALSSEYQRIDSLGMSPKGQYVAVEEYGYRSQSHTYYVKIKILNVWKKEYVGAPVFVEAPAHRPISLQKARGDARRFAKSTLDKFQISL